jgi:hypothetical protein
MLLDFTSFEALTFDCCGRLIDWESGIWIFLRSMLAANQVMSTREQALELYAKIEFEIRRKASLLDPRKSWLLFDHSRA